MRQPPSRKGISSARPRMRSRNWRWAGSSGGAVHPPHEDHPLMSDVSRRPAARLITFEGGEGVGKSTEVKRLLTRLNRRDIPAIRTREPGGTPRAEAIRAFILQGRSENWGPGAE